MPVEITHISNSVPELNSSSSSNGCETTRQHSPVPFIYDDGSSDDFSQRETPQSSMTCMGWIPMPEIFECNDDNPVFFECSDTRAFDDDVLASSSNKKENRDKKSGMVGAVVNLVNYHVGGSINGIPYALKLSGFLTGLYLLVGTALLARKSLRLIVDLARFHPKLRHANVDTYEGLASYPFGKAGEKLVLFATFAMSYGGLVSLLIIAKDTLPTALGFPVDDDAWTAELILVIVSVLVILPLSMQKHVASLAFTSVLSVVATIALFVFVTLYSPVNEAVGDAGGFLNVLTTDPIKPTFMLGMGVLSDAFATQHAALVLSGSLANLTRHRWGIVTTSGVFLSALCYANFAVVGYLGFLDDTQGDILNNFPAEGMFGNMARLLLGVSMCLTYPLDSLVCRHVLTAMLHNGDEAVQPSTKRQRQMMTLVVLVLALVPAILLDDLGIVVALSGAVGGTIVAYILPGLLYLGIYGHEFLVLVSRAFENFHIFHCGQRIGECCVGEYEDNEDKIHDKNRGSDIDFCKVENESEKSASFCYREVKQNIVTSCEDNILWYILGMPLWCRVASWGKRGMEQRLANVDFESYNDDNDKIAKDWKEQSDIMAEPRAWDFVVAILFVVYGTMSFLGGLACVVYDEA